MKEEKKQKLTGLEWLLYITAIIALAYGIYVFFANWITLKDYYTAQGQSRAENWQQVMQTLVNGSGVYILFSIVLYSIASAIGYFRDQITGLTGAAVPDTGSAGTSETEDAEDVTENDGQEDQEDEASSGREAEKKNEDNASAADPVSEEEDHPDEDNNAGRTEESTSDTDSDTGDSSL